MTIKYQKQTFLLFLFLILLYLALYTLYKQHLKNLRQHEFEKITNHIRTLFDLELQKKCKYVAFELDSILNNKNLLKDAFAKETIKKIVRFAKESNIKCIAEFVENKEVFDLLREYGVDEFQGYYVGYPSDLINS